MEGGKEAGDISALLGSVRPEVIRKAECRLARDGVFRAVLKSAFVRAHGYAEYANSPRLKSGPDAFFGSAALRQCCEDLIALKFLAALGRTDRDAVAGALMVLSTSRAWEKQDLFFRRNRPFQPIIAPAFSPGQVTGAKRRLDEIGTRTGLWSTKGKLPPIEQMAAAAHLSELYEYLYAATSECVHFNVRVSLRFGWGDPATGLFSFSPANFAEFYSEFTRVYAAYVWVEFCRAFRSSLGLSEELMDAAGEIELSLESVRRWPELVTFEEMNVPQNRNIVLQGLLEMLRSDRVERLRKRRDAERARRGCAPAAPSRNKGSGRGRRDR